MKRIHIILTIANSSSVPYFSCFAEKVQKHPEIKLSFICLFDKKPQMLEEMKEKACDCYWVPFDYKSRKISMIKAFIDLYILYKRIKPDIVHSHLFDDSLPSLMAARLAGIKHRFITKQDTAFHWYYAPKAVKFDKLNNFLATHIIAVSEECKKFILEKEHADPTKLYLIHHGISLDKLSHSTEEYKTELIARYNLKNKIIIGTVARLIEWKGHRILIDVAEKIIRQNPAIIFLFIGEGELKPDIIKIIEEKKLSENILLTGWIEREKIPSLYSIMDIYIHAAKYEPFGFVIAEAMLNGTPVLSTKTGAALDAIQNKENGYLVNYNSVDEFVDGINFLLSNDKKSIGEKGKITAKTMYNFDKMYESYVALYKKAIIENEKK